MCGTSPLSEEVKQGILAFLGEGKLYLTRHWTAAQSVRAWRNFRRLAPLSTRRSDHRLVALDSAG